MVNNSSLWGKQLSGTSKGVGAGAGAGFSSTQTKFF